MHRTQAPQARPEIEEEKTSTATGKHDDSPHHTRGASRSATHRTGAGDPGSLAVRELLVISAGSGAAANASSGFGPGLKEVFGPAVEGTGPELIQLLTPEGERVEHPEFAFDEDDETIKSFYRDLVMTRRIDTEATALQRQGELGIWASLLGQEAAQIGSGRAMREQDFAFPTYREHGVAWCRGIDPLHLLGLFRGVDQGGWDPLADKFNLYTIVIGAQTLHATGYAMGLQRDGLIGTGDPDRDTAVIGYFGDGATSQGDVNEAFIWASVFNAPVVFFCQNNQWAISEPIERQSKIPLYQRALGFGFPGLRVDGNDVLAVYAVTKAALQRAREGSGPTFVEAYTYRMGAHTTSDDPTRYRVIDELEHWKLKDPIERVKAYLSRGGVADDAYYAEIEAEGDEMAARLRKGCLELPDPSPLDIFDQVYEEQTPELVAQREQFASYLASFEGGQS
ncbi:MAG: pyruvate dehydrogenase (acetyl-transferring) E1 component subunit alpha [Nocardioidaceae bacterium]|nr:pyruvate dehydrogenase (acetyl-transferring) E1 component subunit alpha [Nocardioidaceae bacterium]